MKKFLSVILVSLSIAMFMSSCQKDRIPTPVEQKLSAAALERKCHHPVVVPQCLSAVGIFSPAAQLSGEFTATVSFNNPDNLLKVIKEKVTDATGKIVEQRDLQIIRLGPDSFQIHFLTAGYTSPCIIRVDSYIGMNTAPCNTVAGQYSF